MKNRIIELLLFIVGTITLIASLVFKNEELKYLLNLITILSWAISAFLIALEYKFSNFLNLIHKGGEGINIIEAEENYFYAKKCLKDANQVKATFFTDFTWTLQPNERGYEEQFCENNIQNRNRVEYESYFERLQKRLNNGELLYDWIVYIESKKKYLNLIDRVKTTVINNEIAIKKGNVMLHVLPHSKIDINNKIQPPFSQINIQIAKKSNTKNLLITPMKNRLELNSSILINAINNETSSICEVYNDWFHLVKDQCIPIINKGKIYLDNLIKEGLMLGYDEKYITMEINQIITESAIKNVQIIYTKNDLVTT